MVNPVAEFLVGAAVIVTPQYQVPLLIGGAALKLGTSLVSRGNKSGDSQEEVAHNGGGGPERVTLEWDRLSVALPKKKSSGTEPIFKDLKGSAKPGRLLAIMGSSGAGKTTLLNCLAGQLPHGKGVDYTGTIAINGAPAAVSKHRQAYVKQDDVFYSQLTVRETLTTAAKLQMGGDDGAEEVVEALIEKLGLSKAADTIVGNAKVRGLSGGERKRLSIACELLGDPSLLFCDEPTTGLDSFQAEQVMKALKQLAGEGKTVVVAIHQPRSSIFALFDDLVLLSEGGLVYSGPASEAVDYFEGQGFSCPPNYNPAEFLADLISVDQSSPEAGKETRERVEKLLAACRSSPQAHVEAVSRAEGLPKNGHEDEEVPQIAKRRAAKWGLQARVLLQRSWRQIKRDKATTVARIMSNVSSAAIFGSIYWRMGRRQVGVQNRMGLLQVAAINCAMSSVVKTLGVFSQERVIVERERSKGSYEVGPYFGAKLAAESPIGAVFPLLFGCLLYPTTGLNPKLSRFAKFLGILTLESFVSSSVGLAVGSVAPSPDAAQAIGPAIMVIFIVFGGLYVNSSGVPRALRWLPKASLIKHAFEALCVNEFKGLEFDASEPQAAGDALVGEQVLQRLSFHDSSVRQAMAGEARILLFNYWFTYCVLKARRPKFQQLQPPDSSATVEELDA